MPCVGRLFQMPSLSTGCDNSKTGWHRDAYSKAQAKPKMLLEKKRILEKGLAF